MHLLIRKALAVSNIWISPTKNNYLASVKIAYTVNIYVELTDL